MVIVFFVALGTIYVPQNPPTKMWWRNKHPHAFPCRKMWIKSPENLEVLQWSLCGIYLTLAVWKQWIFRLADGGNKINASPPLFHPSTKFNLGSSLNKKTERIFHSKMRKLWARPLPIASCPNRSWPKSIWKTLGRQVGALTVGSLIPAPLEWEIFSSKTFETSRGWKNISHKKPKEKEIWY